MRVSAWTPITQLVRLHMHSGGYQPVSPTAQAESAGEAFFLAKNMKICCQCRKDLPLSDFYNDSHKPDGKRPECISCFKSGAPCSVPDCTRIAATSGMCSLHYQRFKKHGDVNFVFVRHQEPVLERFQKKFEIDTETECWNWTAAIKTKGYGAFALGDGKVAELSHRAAYKLYIGPIPDGPGYHGICVLHRCDNRKCVNPKHLFLGSHQDNMDDMKKKNRARNGWSTKK